MPSEYAIQVAARIWCDPRNCNTVMDVNLCTTFAEILDAHIKTEKPPEKPLRPKYRYLDDDWQPAGDIEWR